MFFRTVLTFFVRVGAGVDAFRDTGAFFAVTVFCEDGRDLHFAMETDVMILSAGGALPSAMTVVGDGTRGGLHSDGAMRGVEMTESDAGIERRANGTTAASRTRFELAGGALPSVMMVVGEGTRGGLRLEGAKRAVETTGSNAGTERRDDGASAALRTRFDEGSRQPEGGVA